MAIDAKICCITVAAILLRWTVSLNSYSGHKTPPMYGDYEAQRHWQEITLNLPPGEWYKNTTQNDLLYWGLDYPPLTAYHSYVCGYVARLINPDWVALNTSRGYESYQHKLFMRYSVLAADLVVFVPAVLYYVMSQWRLGAKEKIFGAMALLLSPGLILIDYGHFQYNGVSLGLALLAMTFLDKGHDLFGSVAFMLALNYKQMELYHAMPFFCYLLGSCFQVSLPKGFLKLMMLGLVVIITMVTCWLPFLSDLDSALAVLRRLFPFNRGLYEDKVANVWCSLSVVMKLKQLIVQEKLVLMCLGSTLVMLLPSSLHVLTKPTIENFKLALVNSSLVFFLFSFQVHEKSILLAAVPIAALAPSFPLPSVWFMVISTFSMLPLLVKDGLLLESVGLTVLYMIVMMYSQQAYTDKQAEGAGKTLVKILFTLSCLGAGALTVASQVVKAPVRLPDLFPVLISIYSCMHFILFLLYFTYYQLFQTGYKKYISVQTSKKISKKTN
ncbi:dolichyl pyrophosphate Man9GlcNAc2 alpha-1,3-glucosyltransferase-like [Haliotis rubra]|uniref:dolichyl pyrophosphate Man9GlcNAc2 alpha-1,3-glucosyltransferase-like n=1 Tax=Haliotis rubra TaxID=36100 RepID=UPI001EE54C89|nr:dolichyl pyrophosphate Man9GlcNAc2 alpha-1,3-glucosyltransferase-like [Haliotis rubra]